MTLSCRHGNNGEKCGTKYNKADRHKSRAHMKVLTHINTLNLTGLHACQLACLFANLLACLQTCLVTFQLAGLLANLLAYLPTCLIACQLACHVSFQSVGSLFKKKKKLVEKKKEKSRTRTTLGSVDSKDGCFVYIWLPLTTRARDPLT